jgi:hypothetical protein
MFKCRRRASCWNVWLLASCTERERGGEGRQSWVVGERGSTLCGAAEVSLRFFTFLTMTSLATYVSKRWKNDMAGQQQQQRQRSQGRAEADRECERDRETSTTGRQRRRHVVNVAAKRMRGHGRTRAGAAATLKAAADGTDADTGAGAGKSTAGHGLELKALPPVPPVPEHTNGDGARVNDEHGGVSDKRLPPLPPDAKDTRGPVLVPDAMSLGSAAVHGDLLADATGACHAHSATRRPLCG